MATMKQDKQDGASNYLLKTEPSEYSFADLHVIRNPLDNFDSLPALQFRVDIEAIQ